MEKSKLLKLRELEEKANVLRDEIGSRKLALNAICESIDSFKTERDIEIINSGNIDWFWLLSSKDETMVKYKYMEEKLRELNLWTSGNILETEQNQIKIAFYDDVSVQDILKGLNEILPFIKPLKDGYKEISIHDKDCCEYGSYYLEIYEDRFDITKTGWCQCSVREILKSFTSLEEALKYIAKNI